MGFAIDPVWAEKFSEVRIQCTEVECSIEIFVAVCWSHRSKGMRVRALFHHDTIYAFQPFAARHGVSDLECAHHLSGQLGGRQV